MIRVAIIGAGIGAEHLNGYLRLPERFEVTTLCDLDTARATRVAGQRRIAVRDDLDAVLQDHTVDLIDICLPPHLHAPVAVKALEAGKDVIVEKPLTRSLQEADALCAVARRSKGRLFPVFQYRFGKGMSQLATLRDAGLLGKPFVASLETHWSRDSAYYAVPWRGTWAGEAGGAVLGHAIHAHDLLCQVLGPVAEVFALADTRVNPIETEDCAALTFRMESGALATSSVTLGAGDDSSRLRFCFEGVTAQSTGGPYDPANAEWRFVARGAVSQDQITRALSDLPDPHFGFAGFLETVACALEGGHAGAVDLAEGRQSIELVTAIYTSIRSKRPVALPLGKDTPLYAGWQP